MGGSLVVSVVFEQITWGQDTWIRALQGEATCDSSNLTAAEPVSAVTFITLWILFPKHDDGRSHSENGNGSPLLLQNAHDSAEKQRRSSFFPPALIVEHPSRPPAVAIPAPSLVGSHDFSQTPDSERPFHFDDLSSRSGTLSPSMTLDWVKGEALDSNAEHSDATTSSVYSLPSYKSRSEASLVPDRTSRTRNIASVAITHILKIRRGSPQQVAEAPRTVDRFGRRMI